MRSAIKSLIIGAVAGLLPVSAAFADDKGKVIEEKIPNFPNATFKMVKIPAGKFTMAPVGKDGKAEEKEIKSFWIGQTEMTWDVFDVFAFSLDLTEEEKKKDDSLPKENRSRPSKPYGAPDHGFGHQGYAAISMHYKSAARFCEWLSAKTGKKYRLPTEAEWEYAASLGGKVQAQAGGLDAAEMLKIAQVKDGPAMKDEEKPQPVAKLAANEWGLYDMFGNVVEWCTGVDGKPVARGGSYKNSAKVLHPGFRQLQQPSWNSTDPNDPKSTWWLSDGKFVGFRVVMEE